MYSALTIVALYFLFAGLIKAKPFLAPLLLGVVLSFLMYPVSHKLEMWGLHKVMATFLSTLLLLLVAVGFSFIVFTQVKSFTADWEEIQDRLTVQVEELTDYLVERTPLTHDQIAGYGLGIGRRQSGDGGSARGIYMIRSAFGYLTQLLIILVYVFLFIHFRGRFRKFILRLVPGERQQEVSEIIDKASAVSRRYLAGKLLLMVFLAILYFIGLFISGLENAFLISLLSAALSIIPVIGNLFGFFIAIAVSLLTDGGAGTLIGITITFAMAQFIDTYILQPIVLGDKVDVHPVFIIISVVLGYLVWGLIGLVLAIPLFGMIAVICRYVPVLKPFGYLFSMNHSAADDSHSEEA